MIEKIFEKCYVWKYKLVSLKLKWKKWDYACVFKWDFNSIWWTLSIWIDKNKNIVLINIYRHWIDAKSWEFVRWGLEKEFSEEENALKEFEEETGINEKPINIQKLGVLNQDNGILWNYLSYILLEFEDLTKFDIYGEKDGSYEEIFGVKLFSKEEFEYMIKNGKIKDACTISAYGFLKLYNKI